MLNKLHAEILAELKKQSGNGTKHSGNGSYLGNDHFSYHLSNPVKHVITKAFLKKHADLSFKEFLIVVDSLFAAPSYDEKSMAAMLVDYSHKNRKQLTVKNIDGWLNYLVGWAEVDSLCQSSFTAEEILEEWPVWEKALTKFSKDKNVHKRRASLVLLTGPVAHSTDVRLSTLAFKTIDRLKSENDILITKAVSWLLRSLIRNHKRDVAAYIKVNSSTLPNIAVRETTRKLLTGRK